MNELLGYGEKETAEAAPAAPVMEMEEEPAATAEPQKPLFSEIIMPAEEKELPVRREEAIIPSDMVIDGNITTQSNMKIFGSINGNVTCDGNIWLMGSILGDVSAENLTISRGGLTGDAAIRENVVMEQDSIMKGNLTAQNVSSDARIDGELHVEQTIELRENAFVNGNLKARAISVASGAKIKGLVDVNEW